MRSEHEGWVVVFRHALLLVKTSKAKQSGFLATVARLGAFWTEGSEARLALLNTVPANPLLAPFALPFRRHRASLEKLADGARSALALLLLAIIRPLGGRVASMLEGGGGCGCEVVCECSCVGSLGMFLEAFIFFFFFLTFRKVMFVVVLLHGVHRPLLGM